MTLAVMTISLNCAAQRRGGQDHGWWDRVKSEKIAFLTAEMNLTPAEAQVFWPVYNQADNERFKCQETVFSAFRALEEAVKEGKSEKELTALVKAYTKASVEAQGVDSKYLNEYMKILPGSKVAKLCLGEEKFRQQQIFKLRRDIQPGHQPSQRGDRPQQSK